MVPFDVVTESDDMVCNNEGMTILCKSFLKILNIPVM